MIPILALLLYGSTFMFFLYSLRMINIHILRYIKKFPVDLMARLSYNLIHQLVEYCWVTLLSHYVSINFIFWTPFFIFLQTILLINLIYLPFDLFESSTVLNLLRHLLFWFQLSFLFLFFFFVLFQMLWMLVTVNKIRYMACHGLHGS